ncbi:YcxB family protein [Terribacillus aidingensis]|uniref:YcxB family protein n=1 Tax=Terribacillus aidingensis TaxID=586416 RepID=UPI00345054D2
MIAEFKLDDSSFVHLQKNFVKNSSQYKKKRILPLIISSLIFICYAIYQMFTGEVSLMFALITYPILLVIWILAGNYMFHKLNEKNALNEGYKKGFNEFLKGTYKIEFNPQVLEVTKDGNKNRLEWKEFKKVDEDELYIFLYFPKDITLVVPKFRNNLSEEENAELIKRIKSKVN